jgi:hypothetical protein
MESLLKPLLIFIGMKEIEEGALEVEDELSPLFYEFLDPPLVPASSSAPYFPATTPLPLSALATRLAYLTLLPQLPNPALPLMSHTVTPQHHVSWRRNSGSFDGTTITYLAAAPPTVSSTLSLAKG